MPNTFPYLSHQGFSFDDEAQAIVETYPGDPPSFRFYKQANTVMKVETMTLRRLTQTKLSTIRAFFAANMFLSFYVYDPADGVTNLTFDPTGVATTGRHLAIFYSGAGSPPKLSVKNAGNCIYDVDVQVLLLS